ncbi:MAG: hypothetical protein JWO05_3278 [Gemmatimonadetes bacterium]|nr:hypothetical protein [Gemmatimonadota bacterium]
MLLRTIFILVLLVLNAFFVAAEFSLVRARRTRLESMARSGDWMARLALKASGQLGRVLSASQLGVTLASIGLGALAEASLGDYFTGQLSRLPVALELATRAGIAAAISIAIVTYFHVVFGELAPKSAALNHSEQVARWLTPPFLVFAWFMTPFIVVLDRSSRLVIRLTGGDVTHSEENVHSPEELRMLVEQSEESGALHKRDAALIEGVFEFSEKNAREVMTPRTQLYAIEVHATLDETMAIVLESRHSRYPVYEETIDEVVGMVLAKDLLPILHAPPKAFSLRALMRPVHVVPGTREVEDVLADFKKMKEHLAIVLDEYGGTAGVVTMEDLLEEIVGDILDEYDEAVAEQAGGAGSADLVVVPGDSNIGELNERFALAVPEDDYTTIGGFVFGTLGRLPVPGDRVTAGNAVFTVRAMDGRRVASLSVDLHSAGDRRGREREAGRQAGESPE